MAPSAMLAPVSTKQASKQNSLATDANGFSGLGGALGIVGVIVGAIVAVLIVAALFPQFMSALSGINGNLNDPNTTTGDATADSLIPVFSLVIGLAGLFGIVGIILAAVHFGKKNA